MSTYNEALEKMNEMQDFSHTRKVIKQGNSNNEDSYYVDYVSTINMGMSRMISEDANRCMGFEMIGFEKDISTPPVGRTETQHRIVLNLNRRKR